jgi:hypothetical protein
MAHVCSHREVVEICSKWFIGLEGSMDDLPLVLDLYGELRDSGQKHQFIRDRLEFITTEAFLKKLKKSMVTVEKIPDIRLIRED